MKLSRTEENLVHQEEALNVAPQAIPPVPDVVDDEAAEAAKAAEKPEDSWHFGPISVNKELLPIKLTYFTYYGGEHAFSLNVYCPQIYSENSTY